MDKPIYSHRNAALVLLNGNFPLTHQAGQFLGQIVVDPSPLTDAQANWLAKLLAKHGLPPCVPSESPAKRCHT